MKTEETIKGVWKKFGIDVETARRQSTMIPKAIKPVLCHLEFLKKLEGPRGNEALEQKGARHDASQRTVINSYQQTNSNINSNINSNGKEKIYAYINLNTNSKLRKEPHMRVAQAFPSNFLKVDDLQNRRVQVTIANVAIEEVGDSNKPVVYFKGKDKGLVLNKTNAAMIEEIAKTDEMDNWTGAQIVLYPARVDFQGKRVPAIRVDYPGNGKPVAASVIEQGNDDISF